MSHSDNAALLTPHSILKKPHPASVSGTPRSRSPVSFRDVNSGSSSVGGESSTPSDSQMSFEHPNNLTPSTPFYPSPLRGTLASSTDDDSTADALQVSTTTLPRNVDPDQNAEQPGPPASAPPSLPSILRTSSTQGQGEHIEQIDSNPSSPQQSIRILDGGSVGGASPRGQLLHLPGSASYSAETSPWGGSGTPLSSSSGRNDSPSGMDRSRIVGKGGYGGRRGGPTLNKNRTSSSGGLSDVDMRPGYERKVGFDTMIDADDTPNGYFTFCLQVKSRGYMRTKNTRTFMCAVDDNGYSERALEWLMDSLASDGDEIVAVRVLEGDPDEIDQDAAREEARDLMASIVELNDEYGDRSISIVVEFVAGRVTSTLLALIYMYRPDSITVGTRGRSVSTFHKMLGASFIGSCSRDVLNTSPVPVVIVRPEAKVKKHLAKRQNDPKRRSYHDLVALSKEDHLPLSVSNHSKRNSILHGHLSVPRHSKS